MASGQNRIDFQVGISVDKSGLSEMQSLFQQIAFKAQEPGKKMDAGFQQAAKTATTLDGILSKTFNSDLGSLNVTKFNQELSKCGLSLKDVKANLSQAGNQGVTAFNRLSQAILGTNQQIRQSSKMLDQMFTTFKNTVRYGISSSIFNNFTNSISKAFEFSKKLDTSLNDIRIVTDKSAESMAEFAVQANEAAKSMGASTLDYTNAALIYYQQGLSDAEVQARAETTIKAANVTGQTGEEVSEQLTAVWNGYKVSAQETEAYVDKLAAVAATTAADLEELSVGMSKVASAANAMGVDFDDLNAQIATIVSVTRQAPESVGTALKTIYARLGDLKVDGGVDEFGVTLGDVSEQLNAMGIQILKDNGDLRDMSSVIAEVAEKWGTWTQAQRQAAAVAMAGKRQYNNLIALFDNWDMYTDALNTSTDALGTLQHQQDIYMESTAAKLKTLKAVWQGLYDDAINEDEVNAGIEALTNLVEVFDNFIDSFGGGIKSIAGFGAIISNIFNRQIAESINNANQRIQIFKSNLELAQANAQMRSFGTGGQLDEKASSMDYAVEANSKIQLEYAEKIYQVRAGLNQEQANILVNLQREIGGLEQEKVLLDEQVNKIEQKVKFTDTEVQELKELSDYEFEINSIYGNRVENANILIELTQQAQQTLAEGVTTEEAISNFKQTVLEVTKNLNQEEKNKLNTLLQNLSTEEDLINIYTQLEDVLEISLDKNKENLSIEQKKAAAAEIVAQKYKEQQKVLEQQNNKKQQADSMLEAAKSASVLTQNIITVTSALGNMAMAWSSVNTLIDTWNNKEVSFGDKITRTLMTLGMTLPMFINNFRKLNEVFDFSSSSLKTLKTAEEAELVTRRLSNTQTAIEIAQSQARIAMDEAEIALTGLKKSTRESELRYTIASISQKEAEAIVTGKMTLAETEYFITKGYANRYTEEETVALLAGVKAKVLHAKATQMETAAQEELNVAMSANPVGAVILAITALVAVVAIAVSAYDNYNKRILENAKASVENAKSKQAEIDANEELYQSYKQSLSAYEDGVGSREDLNSAIEKVCDAYDIEVSKLDILAGKYEKVTEAIKAKRDADLQESKTTLETGLSNQGIVAFQEGREGRGRKVGSDYKVDLHSYNPFAFLDYNLEQAVSNNVDSSLRDNSGFLSFDIDYGNMEQMVQLYDELSKAQEEYLGNVTAEQAAQSADYQVFLEWMNRVGPEIESYKEIQEQLKNTNAEIAVNQVDFDKVSNLSEYKEKLQEVVNILTEAGFTEEEAASFAALHASALNDNLQYLQNEIDLIDDISNRTKISPEELTHYVEGLSDKEREILFSGRVIFDGLQTTEEVEKALKIAQEQVGREDLEVVASLRTKVTSDKKLTKKQIEEAVGEQSLLSKEYEVELSSFDESSTLKQTDILNGIVEDKIKLNQQYIESAQEVAQEELRNLELNEKRLQIEKANLEGKRHAQALTEEEKVRLEEVNDALEKVISREQEVQDIAENGLSFEEIENLNFENIITGIDGVISVAGVLRDLAEDVGENWTIAADKIENFAQNFPELLSAQENYNVLQDGSVQLTEQGRAALHNLVEERKADLLAQNEAYQLEIQKQIDIQQATAEYYKNQADLLAEHLETDSEAKEVQAKMEKNLADYKAKLMETTGLNDTELNRVMQENLDATNINAQGDTEDIYNYWCSVGNAAKLAALAYQNKEFNPPGFNGGSNAGSGSNTVSYEGAKMEDTEHLLEEMTREQKQQLLDEYRKLQQDAEAKVGELTAKKLAAGASAQAAVHALENIDSGKAGKDSNSKSGGSKDKDKELKKLEEEFDRYWEIHKALDLIDRDLKKLNKDQENLYGKELIRSLKQENELLNNQAQLYEQLAAAQEAEAAELRGQLAASGVVFDASGAVLNYAEATAAALAAYNKAVQEYNAGLLDDAAFKIHEKAFEEFKKALERYDTLFYQEMKETQEKLDDIRREILANNLKAWEVEIQLKLDFKQLRRDWNDFIHEVTEDFQKVFKDLRTDMKNMLDDAKTYIGKEGTINTIIKAVKDVTKEIDKMMGGGESDMFESVSQAQEKLKELNDQLLDAGKSLHDLWKEAWDAYIEGIDQVSDKFDNLMDRFERINDELEFQKKIIELLYGDEAYKLMSKYYEAQINNSKTQMSSLKQQVDMWEKLFKDSGATMDNQNDWTEDQQKYYENWQEAQSKLNDSVLDYIELLQNDYLNTVQDILKELETSMTGGSSLKKINEEWERISEQADKYYDSIEKAYQIQSLGNKIDSSINSTNSLKAQQKLVDLKEKEINYLREKEKLTEYDIKAAELRYQIALKEIALEDAQQNKTSMKLTRNDQGNWSYQYVADENDIASKRQELLDTYNELYQLASDAYEANLESMQELEQKYLEKIQEISNNTLLTDEERRTQLEEARTQFEQDINDLAEENELYRQDLANAGSAMLLEIYNQDETAYEAMTDSERAMVDALIAANIDDFADLEDKVSQNYQNIGDKSKEMMSETRADWKSSAQELTNLAGNLDKYIQQAYTDIEKANNKYKDAVDECARIVERDFSEEGIVGAIQKAEEETDKLKDKTRVLVEESHTELTKLKGYVNEIEQAWKSVQQAIMNAINLIDEYLRKVGEANQASQQQGTIGGTETGETETGKKGGSDGGSTGKKSFTGNIYRLNDDGEDYSYQGYGTIIGDPNKIWQKGNNVYVEYATGGYTGSWGDNSGRMAVLHQKELVLNADDTKNFLSGINMIRQLSSGLNGSIENAVLKAVANTALSLDGMTSNPSLGNTVSNNNSTDNVFNITAEFPNANNVDDIRQAILSLPNIASQYVNSNLR